MPASAARRSSVSAILPALAVVYLCACGGGETDPDHSAFSHDGTLLQPDLVIGADLDAAPEFQFVRIQDVLPLDDGSFWVIDGLLDEANTSIRRYDASGTFLGEVGQGGDGPGDFRRPRALAQLDDGRVLLTDQLFHRRLTLFHPDGTLDEVVRVDDAYFVGPQSPSRSTFMDAGLIWRWSVVSPPRPGRPPAFWSRIRLDGTAVDTVHPPRLPELSRRSVVYESRDGRTTRGFGLPYRPSATWAITRSGNFLIVPEDAYRVYRLVRPSGGEEARRELFISRDVPRVAVSEAERTALRDRTRTDIADFAREREISLDLDVPEVPSEKPFVRGLWALRDGGAMVRVSMPSVETPSGWVEPNGWDVFDEDGRFRGRVVLPDGHVLHDVRDGNVWTVFWDELGIPSIHRHPLPF